MPIATKKEILKAIYPKCWICRLPFAEHPDLRRTIDHYLPRSKGGDNGLDNLRYAHGFCNRWRGNKVGNPSKALKDHCREHHRKLMDKLEMIVPDRQPYIENDKADDQSPIKALAVQLTDTEVRG
jgi:hypothetical protein